MKKTILIGIVMMIFISTFALALSNIDISSNLPTPPEFIREQATGNIVVKSEGQTYMYQPTATPSIYSVNMNNHIYYVDIQSGTYTDKDGTPIMSLPKDPVFSKPEAKTFLAENPEAITYTSKPIGLNSPTPETAAPTSETTPPPETPPAQPAETKTENIKDATYDPNSNTVTFIVNDKPASIPAFMVRSALIFDKDGKVVGVDNSKLNGMIQDAKMETDEKGNPVFIFTVNERASYSSEFDRGTWTQEAITDPADPKHALGYRYTREDGEAIEVYQSGSAIVMHDPKSGSTKIFSASGQELYSCGGGSTDKYNIFCKSLYQCGKGQTTDCFPVGEGSESKPIIVTGGDGLRGFMIKNQCYANGQRMEYDSTTKSCSVVRPANASAITGISKANTAVSVVNSEGTIIDITFDEAGNVKCSPPQEDCAKYQGLADSVVYRHIVGVGISSGLSEAAQVGGFINLGKTYGWWKTDKDFLGLEKLFEDVVLLRAVTEPERMICEEMNTAYNDLAKEGFLPTASGQSGADIQATRYEVTEINITTGNVSETFQRYKVTYHVNAQAILKKPVSDINQNYLQKYETSVQVFLDEKNITKKTDLCVGDCSDDTSSSAGTSSVPLIIKSEKVFGKACIKFDVSDDMDPYVERYLSDNDNRICNDVIVGYVPSRAVTPLPGTTGGAALPNATNTTGTGGTGTGSGGGTGSGNSGEIVI